MPLDDPACFRIDRIPVRPIHWLWPPYLPCGKLAVLDGNPGAGKSHFTADLAARLTCGKAASRTGNGPNRPRQTGPNNANERKAARPPSRAVAPLAV